MKTKKQFIRMGLISLILIIVTGSEVPLPKEAEAVAIATSPFFKMSVDSFQFLRVSIFKAMRVLIFFVAMYFVSPY